MCNLGLGPHHCFALGLVYFGFRLASVIFLTSKRGGFDWGVLSQRGLSSNLTNMVKTGYFVINLLYTGTINLSKSHLHSVLFNAEWGNYYYYYYYYTVTSCKIIGVLILVQRPCSVILVLHVTRAHQSIVKMYLSIDDESRVL